MSNKINRKIYQVSTQGSETTEDGLHTSISDRMGVLNSQTRIQKRSFMPNKIKKFKSQIGLDKHKQFINQKNKWKSEGNRSDTGRGTLGAKIDLKPLEKKRLDDDFGARASQKELHGKQSFLSNDSSVLSLEGEDMPSFAFDSAYEVSLGRNLRAKRSKADHSFDGFSQGIFDDSEAENSLKFSSMTQLSLITGNDESEAGRVSSTFNVKLPSTKDKSILESRLASGTGNSRCNGNRKISIDKETYDRVVTSVDEYGDISYEALHKAFFPDGKIPNFKAMCNFRLVQARMLGSE